MKYIASYDINEYKFENRKYVLSAVNKINYIVEALERINHPVKIVSVSKTQNKKFYKGRVCKLKHGELVMFPTLPGGNVVFRKISMLYTRIALFFYLIKSAVKDEEIIVYHSLNYGCAIALAKKIKNFKIILEVEEIYQNAGKLSKVTKKRENQDFAIADKYIFPTELLNNAVNKEKKPYCIIHGTYGVEADRKVSFADDKIHVVYAGTLNVLKGGALAAVTAAEHLSSNYHIHILGFGSDKEVTAIQEVIERTNAKGKATVTYDGLLAGEDYITFLQKCQIGLSTQNPDAAFNDTSFPSKILSYMANGLRVVTVRIPAIEGSAVGEDLYYYEKQTPEEIAKAIMRVDFNDNYDSRKKIEELDKRFCEDIKELLGENKNA